MKRSIGILIVMCATVLGANAATENSSGDWLAPAISYGKVKAMPDASMPLNPAHSYKLLFNVSQGGESPGELIPGAVRAARFLNLAKLAGVPEDQVQLAIVIHGPATRSVLSETIFGERFKGANQNLDLFAQLRKAGVEIVVCGQALAHMQLETDWVTEDVEVAVAALSAVAEYQLRGYQVMP